MQTSRHSQIEDAVNPSVNPRGASCNGDFVPRLTLYLAPNAPSPSASWLEALRKLADCEVRTWDGHSRAIEEKLRATDAFPEAQQHRSALPNESLGRDDGIPVIAFAEWGASPGAPMAKPAPPRGGLAPGVRRRVCDLIDREYGRTLLLSDLAAIAKLSEYHFSRAFKQSLGVPPHRYLLERRIAAAVELVRDTDRCLSDIALEVGFSDQSHFTRLFVRLKGETPRDFRRRHR